VDPAQYQVTSETPVKDERSSWEFTNEL